MARGSSLTFRSLDVDESEEEIKDGQGQVTGWFISNSSAGVRFVKFYNANAADTVVGTTVPLLTLEIPAGQSANALGGAISFTAAITIAATTAVADADTGAPGVNDVVANIFFT